MIEEGLVDLDQTVQSYVPYFGEDKPAITLRQLASHTSGIRALPALFLLSCLRKPEQSAV